MNDEKLKKNMAEILFPVLKGSRISCNEENACKQCWFPCEVDRLADSLADALIAAGIGDVETVQKIAASATAMAVLEAAKAERRAELAERALNKFAENVTCEDCPFFSDCSSSEKMKDSVHQNYCYAEYLRQAEKELAEERKDD